MKVDEGQRENFRDLIPVLFHGEVMDFVVTQHPTYGNIIDRNDFDQKKTSKFGNLTKTKDIVLFRFKSVKFKLCSR